MILKMNQDLEICQQSLIKANFDLKDLDFPVY